MSLRFTSPFGPMQGTLGNLKIRTDRHGVVHVTLCNPSATRKQSKGQKIHNEIFGMIAKYTGQYKELLNSCYAAGNCRTGSHAFSKENFPALKAALRQLATRKVEGEIVTLADINSAIEQYAAQHPNHIRFTKMTGYTDYYLNGALPQQIVLTSTLDGTQVILRHADNTLTTLYPDSAPQSSSQEITLSSKATPDAICINTSETETPPYTPTDSPTVTSSPTPSYDALDDTPLNYNTSGSINPNSQPLLE